MSDTLTIHTDGAARGNPGPAAFSFVIEREGHPPIEHAEVIGETTNNQAEYTALIEALDRALSLGEHHRVVVHSDSELMVKQLSGEYRVKNAELRPLYEEAVELSGRFKGGVEFVHVRREKNKRADALCNEVLDGGRKKPARTSSPSPKPAPARAVSGLEAEAVALLKAAGAASPDTVWTQLVALLYDHGWGPILDP